jgi:cell division protein FtsQ
VIFGRRNRNRTRPVAEPRPPLRERIDWRVVGSLAGAAGAAAVLVAMLAVALDRPVRHVRVEGSFQRVAPPEIEAAVTEVVGGRLATVDLEVVRARIERIEWVDTAVVRRRWPDTLRVEVIEQVPAARWNDTGLLNVRGELFLPKARFVPPELPLLEGPEGTERVVSQLFLDNQGRFLEVGLRLARVRLDERGAWELELANGVLVRLGRLAVTDRVERFLRLAGPLVAQRPAEIRYVDMRYTNGFSVGWNARSALAVAPQEDATPDA